MLSLFQLFSSYTPDGSLSSIAGKGLLGHYNFSLFVGNFILFHSGMETFLDSDLLSIEDSRLLFI